MRVVIPAFVFCLVTGMFSPAAALAASLTNDLQDVDPNHATSAQTSRDGSESPGSQKAALAEMARAATVISTPTSGLTPTLTTDGQDDYLALWMLDSDGPFASPGATATYSVSSGSSSSQAVSPHDVPADEAVAIWNAIWDLFASGGSGGHSQDTLWGSTNAHHTSHMYLPKSIFKSSSELTAEEQAALLGGSTTTDRNLPGGNNLYVNADADGPTGVATPLPMAFTTGLALLAGILVTQNRRTRPI